MPPKGSFPSLLPFVLTVLAAMPGHAWEKGDHYRFIYNSDGGNIFIDKGPGMIPADTHSYVDEVADTQVTTFFLCPNAGMKMLYPSEVAGMIGDHLSPEEMERTREIAKEPGKHTELEIANLRGMVAAGHDPLRPIIDRAKEKGLEIFLTFRLNEVHDVNADDSFLVSDFWKSHPEWRVGKKGDNPAPIYMEILGPRVHPVVASWFWGAPDFAVPEVRDRRLAEIREVCERYSDVDGIDLDFQRFPVYFKAGQEEDNIPLMNDFVRQVREITREIGSKRGRPFMVSVRTMAKPEQNRAIGLDPQTWTEQSWVDFVVASHYLRNDYPIAIREYRKILPENIPLYGSIEVEPERDTYRGIASQLYEDGVDGILLFNFFTGRESGKQPPFDLLNELGDPATIGSTKNSGP
jgi:hypothetical protein